MFNEINLLLENIKKPNSSESQAAQIRSAMGQPGRVLILRENSRADLLKLLPVLFQRSYFLYSKDFFTSPIFMIFWLPNVDVVLEFSGYLRDAGIVKLWWDMSIRHNVAQGIRWVYETFKAEPEGEYLRRPFYDLPLFKTIKPKPLSGNASLIYAILYIFKCMSAFSSLVFITEVIYRYSRNFHHNTVRASSMTNQEIVDEIIDPLQNEVPFYSQ
ncbi:unnamed protein product [Allacma fusca]|uniref:Uncharacterized protein n=1 Tax=Allacma fusca TaxID=39272 RepID=A0A8J2NQZ2_9HEXA|nr:unnamed protein product [Allacma fusca]